jgi:hypothetical protein
MVSATVGRIADIPFARPGQVPTHRQCKGRAGDEVIARQTTFPEAVGSGKIEFSGNPMRLGELMALMDEFPRMFEIVEPKRTVVS